MDTVYNPMMENLRLVLEMNRDKEHSFSKIRVSYAGDSMDVMVLSLIPKWWKVDEQGAYIVTEPPRFIPEIKPKEK